MIQVQPPGGQICTHCQWRHPVAKFATNSNSSTEINFELFYLKHLFVLWTQYLGSVVPLVMFLSIKVWPATLFLQLCCPPCKYRSPRPSRRRPSISEYILTLINIRHGKKNKIFQFKKCIHSKKQPSQRSCMGSRRMILSSIVSDFLVKEGAC